MGGIFILAFCIEIIRQAVFLPIIERIVSLSNTIGHII